VGLLPKRIDLFQTVRCVMQRDPDRTNAFVDPRTSTKTEEPNGAVNVVESSTTSERNTSTAAELHQLVTRLETNMCGVVLGKPQVVRMCMVALLAGEHVLLEDVPGVGKTLVGKALAKSVSGEFCRLQFTPDLLPSDIVGSSIFHAKTSEFIYNRGPIFANIILADEINRAPPRTQSALLEAMSDRQVSVDGTTHALPNPFMVIATQNPFEFEGTYMLPESQLDRFLLRISMGYPSRDDERRVLATHRLREPVDELEPVLNCDQILRLQHQVREVAVEDSIADYMLEIVEVTRRCDELHIGVSTRGALSLYRAAQAAALVDGRDFVVPDDVKDLTSAVFVHRVIPKGFLHAGHRADTEELIRRLVDQIPVPE
jgi:MoxR-like ATPase